MKATITAARNVAGTAALLLAAYIFFTSVSDVRRYIRISRM